MANLVLGIDGSGAKREADAVDSKLQKIIESARGATTATQQFGTKGAGSMGDIRKAASASTDAIRKFQEVVAQGKVGERQMGAAAAQMENFRRKIEAVKATGGPVPPSWLRSLDAQARALDKVTQAAARNRAAVETQRRELEDSTRTAGGFKNGFGSVSDILGEVSPKAENAALKFGLFWGALQVIEGGANRIADAVGVIGTAFGANADVVGKAVDKMKERIKTLFSLGPQMLVFSELMKLRGQDFSGVTGGSSSNPFSNVRGGSSDNSKYLADQKRAAEEAQRALHAYITEQQNFEARSKSVTVAIKAQHDNQQRLTKAYLQGPDAVKKLVKALELEEEIRKNLASGSISDSPIIRFWTEMTARARETTAAIADAIAKMNQLAGLKGLPTSGLEPINSAPSLAAAQKSRFFDEMGLSEADFNKAHENAKQWRDREIAEVKAAAGENIALVQYREQAILDINRAYAEEMVNTAQNFLSRVQGILSSLSALGINVKGASKAVGQAQAGVDLYQQGAGAYQAYNSSAMAGSGIGTVAIMAAAVLIISNWYKQRGSAKSTATIGSKNDGELMWDYRNNPMGRDTIEGVKKAVQEAIKFATDFIKGLGGDFKVGAANVNGVTIGSDGRGKGQTWFVQAANGIITQFGKDMDAALEYAAIQAVKFAPVTGLDPIVAAAIQKSTAMKIEDFQRDVMAAMAVSQLPLSSEGAGFTQSMQGLNSLQEQMIKLLGPTFELADAINNITDAMHNTIKAERDRLLGIKGVEDFTKRLTDAQNFNVQIEKERARILAEIARQEAAMAAAAAANRYPNVGGMGPGNGLGGADAGAHDFDGNFLPSSVSEAQYAIQALMDQLASLGDILNLEDVKKGIKDDILGNLYQFLEGNKKYAAQILAWKKRELEMQFEQYKLQLIMLNMWDEATQKIWADALAAGIKGLGRRGGGGSGKADGVRDALRDYDLSKMSAVTRGIADINDKWDEQAKAAGKNADLLKKIAAARKDEIDQLIRQAKLDLRKDYLGFTGKGGGSIGAAMRGINDSANDLVDRYREMMKLGKMTKAEFQAARDAIRDAAQEQRQGIVTDTANQMFLQMYDLLGKTEESAKLRYELTVAELEIKYKELEIAVAKYELEGGFLPGLRDLIDQVRAGGPALFGSGSGVGGGSGSDPMANTRNWWEETTRRWQQATLRLVDVLGGLALSELSPLSPEQRFAAAQQQYQTTLMQANSGNLDAREALGDMITQYLQEAQSYYGQGTANYANLFQQVNQQGLGVVGNTWAQGENGVMYNAAMGGGQMLQPVIDAITRSGLASATTSTQLYQQSTQQTAIMMMVHNQMATLNAAFARFLVQQAAA